MLESFIYFLVGFLWGKNENKVLPKIENHIVNFFNKFKKH